MDHLFISYAVEDAPLARWLTLKLTVEGYKVWCFEFEMLGGESFPKEIDAAIKSGTFRMLALVSHSSVKKSNPVKEWTLGQAIGAERKLDFVIPLNVDGVKTTELPWTMSDINWIPFYSAGWAGGFKQLLKLLEKLNAPRPIQNGAAISAQTFIPEELATGTPELLYSNTLRFRSIPEFVKGFRWKRSLKENESSEISHRWAYKRVGEKTSAQMRKHRKRGQLEIFTQYEPDDYQYSVDFRRQLKAKAMEFGVPIQILRESTLRPNDNNVFGQRGLTPLSDRAWNLATTLYFVL